MRQTSCSGMRAGRSGSGASCPFPWVLANAPSPNPQRPLPGGFGNKVGVYSSYICSIVLGVPVKWVEDRMENLQATAFARDYHMSGEIREPGRPHHRIARSRPGPTTAPLTPRRPDEIPGWIFQHLHRVL